MKGKRSEAASRRGSRLVKKPSKKGRSELHLKVDEIAGAPEKIPRIKPSTKPPPIRQRRTTIKLSKPDSKRSVRRVGGEEEPESPAGGPAEATEDETSGSEEEEEQRSNEEPEETQSSQEETEASDSQRDTGQTARNVSDASRRESEAGSANGSQSEDKDQDISDEAEDEELTQEDTSGKTAAHRAQRRRRTPQNPKPIQGSKFKMFRKTKSDKQAEKVEKRRIKVERKMLEKEAKQKAKEEKKRQKKEGKPRIQPADCRFSFGKSDLERHEAQSNASDEPDPPVTAAGPEEEEEVKKPTLTKATKGQNRIVLLKAKGKDLRAILEPDGQQEARNAARGHQQKAELISIGQNEMLDGCNEELSEGETPDVSPSNPKEHLIAQRKGLGRFGRMSGWIQKSTPQGPNLRKKLSAWTRVFGIFRWLSLRAARQKQDPITSKRNILKHRMAIRVASKTSLASETKRSPSEATKEACQQGKVGEELAPAGDKEAEAKYAVVLPRMNKLGNTKTAEMVQTAQVHSTPSGITGPPGEPMNAVPKPPKPGARLVLPVKPDLSLLKSIRRPPPGGLPSGGDGVDGSLRPSGPLDSTAVESFDGVSVRQAARRTLDYSQVNLTNNLTNKSLPVGTTASGLARPSGPGPEREAEATVPQSSTQPQPNGEAVMSPARSLYEEEADMEVAQLMGEGGLYAITKPEVHWTGKPRMIGDPQVGETIHEMFSHMSFCQTGERP